MEATDARSAANQQLLDLVLGPLPDDLVPRMRELIAAGATPDDLRPLRKYTLTELALDNWSEPLLKALVACDVSLDQPGKTASSALADAIRTSPEQARLLIKCGAQPDKAGPFGALHLAARFSRFKVVRDLVEAGADLNARDSHGRTPLMAAVASPMVCAALVEAGADIEAQDNAGERAIHYVLDAAVERRCDMAEVLGPMFSRGVDIETPSGHGQVPWLLLLSTPLVRDLPIVKAYLAKCAAQQVVAEVQLLDGPGAAQSPGR